MKGVARPVNYDPVVLVTLGGGLLLLALGVFFVSAPQTFQLTYRKSGPNDDLRITWCFFAWRLPLVSIPVISVKWRLLPAVSYQVEGQAKNQRPLFPLLRDFFRESWPKTQEYLGYLRARRNGIALRSLRWETCVGGGDALETALLAGLVWAGKSNLLAYVLHYTGSKGLRPRLAVAPWYKGPRWDMELDCIVTFRPGHIIVGGLWRSGVLPRLLFRRGDQKGEPSNRSVDENRDGKHQRNGRCQYRSRRRRPGIGRQLDYSRIPRSVRFRRRGF